MDVINDIKQFYRQGNVVIRFILINVGVFLLVNLFLLIEALTQTPIFDSIKWLAAPSAIGSLLVKPWTVVTYMFLHQGFWHLLWNMVILFFAGRIFHDLLGSKRFVSTYFIGGWAGLLLFILFYNVFPVFENQVGAPILGASASIMAIFVGIATYTPNYTVYLPLLGGVKLKYIAIFYVVMDFISIRSGGNPGGNIAHLGGALWGFVWARQLKSGRDIGSWFDILVAYLNAMIPRKQKMKVVHTTKKAAAKQTAQKKADSDVIDAILDKISKSGYDSLSASEKEILFRESNK